MCEAQPFFCFFFYLFILVLKFRVPNTGPRFYLFFVQSTTHKHTPICLCSDLYSTLLISYKMPSLPGVSALTGTLVSKTQINRKVWVSPLAVKQIQTCLVQNACIFFKLNKWEKLISWKKWLGETSDRHGRSRNSRSWNLMCEREGERLKERPTLTHIPISSGHSNERLHNDRHICLGTWSLQKRNRKTKGISQQ